MRRLLLLLPLLGGCGAAEAPSGFVVSEIQRDQDLALRYLERMLEVFEASCPADRPIEFSYEEPPIGGVRGMTVAPLDPALPYRIVVRPGTLDAVVDVMIHEYAHTLAPGDDHGEEWGKAYSRAWMAFVAALQAGAFDDLFQ